VRSFIVPFRGTGCYARACLADGFHSSILSLQFNYAILYTASPVFLASSTVWADIAGSHDGYQQLERGRDAAFAVIQAICSVSRAFHFALAGGNARLADIDFSLKLAARFHSELDDRVGCRSDDTISSFALYRPHLAFALAHLLSLCLVLPTSPLISSSHVLTVLRSTYDTILAANPLDAVLQPSPVRPGTGTSTLSGARTHSVITTATGGPAAAVGTAGAVGGGSLLSEIVELGIPRGREVLGAEPGRELWRMLVG
jgi:hypothetical protein